jgi:chorismate-pyruvate lyase
LESALGQSGTTVTAFLERLVGEPVDAWHQHHVLTDTRTPNLLGVDEGHDLLRRSTVLRGRKSAEAYVHAESLIALGRLPASFSWQLKTSNDPIGRIFTREGIVFNRSALSPRDLARAPLSAGCPVPEDYLFTRAYRVEVAGLPVMVIAEWFLPTLERFLSSC